jgi:hypothetical protein
MTEKFDFYDLLSTLVPGTLLVSWLPICFPALLQISVPKYPDAFAVIVLVALSVFIGQIVLALASIVVEPALYWSWGGRPSDKVFAQGLPNFPKDSGIRIRQKLAAKLGQAASEHSLFLHAMQISEAATSSRVSRFNSLYAYHRSLAALVVICIVTFLLSGKWGIAATWDRSMFLLALAGFAVIFLIVVRRTRQRANYYVREVLLTAERVLDNPTSNVKSGG